MGADVHIEEITSLEDEGVLVVLVQSWEESTKEVVDKIVIAEHAAYPMHHYPYCRGIVSFVKITDNKQVLFCKNCGLRIVIKSISDVKTVKDLRKYFN